MWLQYYLAQKAGRMPAASRENETVDATLETEVLQLQRTLAWAAQGWSLLDAEIERVQDPQTLPRDAVLEIEMLPPGLYPADEMTRRKGEGKRGGDGEGQGELGGLDDGHDSSLAILLRGDALQLSAHTLLSDVLSVFGNMLDFNLLHRNPLLLLLPTFHTRHHPHQRATHTTTADVLRLISSRAPVHLDEFVRAAHFSEGQAHEGGRVRGKLQRCMQRVVISTAYTANCYADVC